MKQALQHLPHKQMKEIVILIIGVILLGACQKTDSFNTADEMVQTASKNLSTITVDELKTKIDSFEMFNLIDVREPSEHNHGYIPGSVNIPRGTLEFNIGNEDFWESTGFYYPEKNELFVLYCKKGSRSILAAETLKKLGYENIYFLDGGWKKWELTFPLLQDKNLELESHGAAEEVGGC
ncbi:rhodanese-like domain-containing protein [uncultured Draconibacterium sp.]|uniref:rhodanese-like domain-containing protein n=1 Tax=uncultured Draconibacterium sp. TaxID=1573823 RepID=UPI002AA62A41|nr:rhodanese-like domain-containing protein [uncultured Draconibacterium sp.]